MKSTWAEKNRERNEYQRNYLNSIYYHKLASKHKEYQRKRYSTRKAIEELIARCLGKTFFQNQFSNVFKKIDLKIGSKAI